MENLSYIVVYSNNKNDTNGKRPNIGKISRSNH